jgi:hypothetical protein
MFSIGNKRFASVYKLNDQTKIDFRIYIENEENKFLPTKQGIALSLDEYEKLKTITPDIDLAMFNLNYNTPGSGMNGYAAPCRGYKSNFRRSSGKGGFNTRSNNGTRSGKLLNVD